MIDAEDMAPPGPTISNLPSSVLSAIFEQLQHQDSKAFQTCAKVCTIWRDMIRNLARKLVILEPDDPFLNPDIDNPLAPVVRIEWKDLEPLSQDIANYPNLTKLLVEIRGVRRIVRPLFWQVLAKYRWVDVHLKGAPERQADKLPPPSLLDLSRDTLLSLKLKEPYLRAGDLALLLQSFPNLQRFKIDCSTYVNSRGFKEILDHMPPLPALIELDMVDAYNNTEGPNEPGPSFILSSAVRLLPSRFPNLQVLTICRNATDVTSSDMQSLARGLRHLKTFKFDTCSDLYMAFSPEGSAWADNAALKVFAEKCPKLESFIVGGENPATADGVRHFLAKAHNIRSFGIAGATSIDGAAWAELLTDQTRLREVFLARINENLIATVPSLTSLENLFVEVTIDDNNSVPETEIASLKELAKQLKGMPQFKRLRLADDERLPPEEEVLIREALGNKDLELVRGEFSGESSESSDDDDGASDDEDMDDEEEFSTDNEDMHDDDDREEEESADEFDHEQDDDLASDDDD